ncbi:MAG: hypothetical protein JNM20_00595 [Rhizobiales bacterium]|jgi:hypothetical protein|nr:hypothetical protein [Hyphomicrobiales bacterium]
MASEKNPAATEHLPFFITAPGATDTLFTVTAAIVIVFIVLLGVAYFRIHALPEHLAHRTTKTQYEIVCVLALLALFTHNNYFWIAALLLAFIQVPDFSTPLASMAKSLSRIAGRAPGSSAASDAPRWGEPTSFDYESK